MWIMLLNRMDAMTPIDASTEEQDIQESLDLMEYLQTNYLNNTSSSHSRQTKPAWVDHHNNDSQSEGENEDVKFTKTQITNFTTKFSKQTKIESCMRSYKAHKRFMSGFEDI